MHFPSKAFWEKLGLEVYGNEDSFELIVPGWAWGLAVIIFVIGLGVVLRMVFG